LIPIVVDREWVAFADDDGVVFSPGESVEPIVATAREIRERERRQASKVQMGLTLREQFRFREYLDRQAGQPDYTFRQHLREIGGAIEE